LGITKIVTRPVVVNIGNWSELLLAKRCAFKVNFIRVLCVFAFKAPLLFKEGWHAQRDGVVTFFVLFV
jgi:hypothetical protein